MVDGGGWWRVAAGDGGRRWAAMSCGGRLEGGWRVADEWLTVRGAVRWHAGGVWAVAFCVIPWRAHLGSRDENSSRFGSSKLCFALLHLLPKPTFLMFTYQL